MPPKHGTPTPEQRPDLNEPGALIGYALRPDDDTTKQQAGGTTPKAPMVDTDDGPLPAWHIFIASASGEKRNDDLIDQNTWQLENYRANPVILWMHNPYQRPIGRGEVWVENEGTPNARLMVKLHWKHAQKEAREFCQDVESRHLNTVSIKARFGQNLWRDSFPETDPRYKRTGWGRYRAYGDLWEISLTTVPGDPGALRQAAPGAPPAPPEAHPAPAFTPASAGISPPSPSSSSQESTVSLRAMMIAALCLAENSSDEQIAASATTLKTERDTLDAAVRTTLNLDAEATLPADVGAQLAAATSKAGFITLAEAQALALAQAGAVKDDPAHLAQVELSAAVQDGRVTPFMKAHFESFAAADPAACLATLKGLKPGSAVPLTQQGGNGPDITQLNDGPGAVVLSAADKQVARQMGLSDEQMIEHKKARLAAQQEAAHVA